MHRNIRLEIETDYAAMSQKGAQIFAKAVKEQPQGAFGFATGDTPIGLYKELIRMHKEDGLDFSGMTTFNLDEYHPISRESEQSYYYFMQKNLFSQINVKPSNIFIPDGSAADPKSESKVFESKIDVSGGIVMQILGIGMNGHIGFNEPSQSFEASTRLVPLAEMTVNSNVKHFPNPDDMPHHAITMGIRTIMMAKHILLLASGGAKGSILRDALLGPITPLVPASALQLHPSVIVVADKEAAVLL